MKLSNNFTLEELLVTSIGVANIPSDIEIDNLRALCINVLQPVRDMIGRPIIITSGFRCKAVNAKVGGVWNSQHTKGEAVDITCGNRVLNRVLYEAIVELGVFDQIINEHNYLWVHISYKKDGINRKQELKIG